MINLGGDITLSGLANECGLSLSYFTRAFKRSTGDAPHRWLLRQRVQHAKTLLRGTQMSLAEIAIVCGFADQKPLHARVRRPHRTGSRRLAAQLVS